MTLRRIMTQGVLYAALVAAWVALWGDLSIANVASGVALVVVIKRINVAAPPALRVNPIALGRLLLLVLTDLVVSTGQVIRAVLMPTPTTNEAIIAVTVDGKHRNHWLLLVMAITLTPGTAVVDTDSDAGVLYLHLLDYRRRAATEATVHRLAALASETFPSEPQRTNP